MPRPFEALGEAILVVEDDPWVLDLITLRLELAGYRSFYARSGVEGVKRLHELRPAAMILDINMPDLDGFGVLRQMAQMEESRRVPTLVLTARKQEADVRTAIQLGASDFMTKPFNGDTFLARVARLTRGKARPRAPAPVQSYGGGATPSVEI